MPLRCASPPFGDVRAEEEESWNGAVNTPLSSFLHHETMTRHNGRMTHADEEACRQGT
eukprot:CAMPEP_0179493934 /NCGR_PEP_ID=MMETSP0799-20121207/67823_1 /TAXON_ID=46947 /ORGANISM="Geminigera cryophila, Strain CCMP2564" /LENGTH=57 /DNA_ID=CAMNT_0021311359 /DNA_START=94 /DNA_END=264 /DNA_ORIENTATION=+